MIRRLKCYNKSFFKIRMHKRILPHGDKDHMGESINLVNNYTVKNIIFNCGSYNYLEKKY